MIAATLSLALSLCSQLPSLSAHQAAVPVMQVVPQPHESANIERDGRKLTAWHFGSELRRPFLFPIIGPSGRSLTRIGHPHDAVGHSHHNSVWISHFDVNGVDFWGDRGKGKIVFRPLVRDAFDDSDQQAVIRARLDWVDEDSSGKALIEERRQITAVPLENDEWLMLLDLELSPTGDRVTFGKTPFGLLGVRMAKTIGVSDGGGRIVNSAGQRGESETLWKEARWVDYSGPIARNAVEGIALFGHPANPNQPTKFHVRDDGWMGASLSLAGPLAVQRDSPLRLRYGIYVHSGAPDLKVLDDQHAAFVRMPLPDWSKIWK
jgi:hypothetical protein